MNPLEKKKYYVPYFTQLQLMKLDVESENIPCISTINGKDVLVTKDDFNVRLYKSVYNDAFIYEFAGVKFPARNLKELTEKLVHSLENDHIPIPDVTSETSKFLISTYALIYANKIKLEYEKYLEYVEQIDDIVIYPEHCCKSCADGKDCEKQTTE